MADPDIFVWLDRKTSPDSDEEHRAATIVAGSRCGAVGLLFISTGGCLVVGAVNLLVMLGGL